MWPTGRSCVETQNLASQKGKETNLPQIWNKWTASLIVRSDAKRLSGPVPKGRYFSNRRSATYGAMTHSSDTAPRQAKPRRGDNETITLVNAIQTITGPQWATGAKWATWANWASINTGYWSWDDLVFQRDDGFEIRLVNAKTTLTWPKWATWANWTWGGGWGDTYYNTYWLLVKTWWVSTSWYICKRDWNTWLVCNLTGFVTSGQLDERIKDWTLTMIKWTTPTIFSANTWSNKSITIPNVTWSDNYICVKEWENLVCNQAKLWTMTDGMLCYYDSGAKTINCTNNTPSNAIISFKSTETWEVFDSFNLNQPSDKTIVIWWNWNGWPWPRWATWAHVTTGYIQYNNIVFELSNGSHITLVDAMLTLKWGTWAQWDTGAVWATGAYVTSGYLSWNDIIFRLSNNNTITIANAVQSITWPQWNTWAQWDTGAKWDTWAAWLWISEITTGKVGKTTTVTITLTDNTTGSFEILDWEDWTGGTWVNATWSHWQRCKYQCEGVTMTVEWNCGEDCKEIQTRYSENLDCNNDAEDNEDCIEFIKGIEKTNPSRVTVSYESDWTDCSIVCKEDAPTCEGQCNGWDWIQVTHYSGGKVCRYMTQEAVDRFNAALNKDEGWILQRTIPEWSWEIRCVFDGGDWGNNTYNEYNTYNIDSWVTNIYTWTRITIHSGTTVHFHTWVIVNYYTGWWDSLWDIDQKLIYDPSSSNIKTKDVLTPIRDDLPLYFATNFYHSGAFNFYTYNSDGLAWPSTRITFDQKWLRVWNGAVYSKGAWASIGWMVAVWIGSNNYKTAARPNAHGSIITIYATWDVDSNDRHYEIMWTHELAVWTMSGAFIYFTYLTGNMTLSANRYKSYSVWINTQTPKATLDVNGSVKLWSNCVPTSCDEERVWTVMYYEKNNVWYYVACKKNKKNTDGTYEFWRYNLLNWNTIATWNTSVDITNYDISCGYVSPKPSDVATGTYYSEYPAEL